MQTLLNMWWIKTIRSFISTSVNAIQAEIYTGRKPRWLTWAIKMTKFCIQLPPLELGGAKICFSHSTAGVGWVSSASIAPWSPGYLNSGKEGELSRVPAFSCPYKWPGSAREAMSLVLERPSPSEKKLYQDNGCTYCTDITTSGPECIFTMSRTTRGSLQYVGR